MCLKKSIEFTYMFFLDLKKDLDLFQIRDFLSGRSKLAIKIQKHVFSIPKLKPLIGTSL